MTRRMSGGCKATISGQCYAGGALYCAQSAWTLRRFAVSRRNKAHGQANEFQLLNKFSKHFSKSGPHHQAQFFLYLADFAMTSVDELFKVSSISPWGSKAHRADENL